MHEVVVGVAARQVEVENQSERARHEHLVCIQLWHRNLQRLAGVGLGRVESDTLHGALGLHGMDGFLAVCGEKVRLYYHWPLLHCNIIPQTYFFVQFKKYNGEYCAIAEGGAELPENPWIDRDLDAHDDDDEIEISRGDTTHPFQPEGSSTPFHGGEEIEMRTHLHETSGCQRFPK